MKWVIVLVFVLWGCGDDRHVDDVLGATGGSQLALQLYRFDDGTEQPDQRELFDTAVHVRCTPGVWNDDLVRCVPIADEAIYTDAVCNTLVGRADTIEKPTHFLAYEVRDGTRRPARVLRAGAATDPITQGFELHDGACVGPVPTAGDATYFAIAGEYDSSLLVGLLDTEVGDGSVSVRVRQGDDGVRVPFGLVDRARAIDCTPVVAPDGGARCEPVDATTASYFGDRACSEPAIVVSVFGAVPSVATITGSDGCATYFAIGDALAGPVFARQPDASCIAVSIGIQRAFALAAPLEPPAVARTVEAVPGHRLSRVVLADGAMQFYDDTLLVDSATRADCRRTAYADGTIRCLPTDLAPAIALFAAGCTLAVPVAVVPRHRCGRTIAFAQGLSAAGDLELRAIGDPAMALFQGFPGQCTPYAPPANTDVRALGPPIDPTAFVGAIYFGAR